MRRKIVENNMYKKFEVFMEERGLSPYRVAKEAHVSQPTLSDWKRGKSEPKRATLEKICNAYGVPISYFYEDSVDSQPIIIEMVDAQSAREKRLLEYARRLMDLGIEPDALEKLIDAVENMQKKD